MAWLAVSIGLISCLNRCDELIVPSWPSESIRMGMASTFPVVLPRIPAIKVLSCVDWPMRIVSDSPATPALAISTLCTSEKEEKAPGEKLPALTPVPDGVEFGQRHEPVNTNSPQTESQIPVPQMPSALHPHASRKVLGRRVCKPDRDRDKPLAGSAASRLLVTLRALTSSSS